MKACDEIIGSNETKHCLAFSECLFHISYVQKDPQLALIKQIVPKWKDLKYPYMF